MGAVSPRGRAWTRRALLSWLAIFPLEAETGRGRILPADRVRYADPATEFPVYRLTNPSYASYLPAYHERAISRRNQFLVFSSDRTGSLEAFRMDLKSGEWRQLTEAKALDPLSLSLAPDDQACWYFDGDGVCRVSLLNLQERVVYRVPEGWRWSGGLAVSRDGAHGALVESSGGRWRVRVVRLRNGSATTAVEAPVALSHPLPRPRRAAVLYRRDADSLWLAAYDGRQNRPARLAPGRIGPAMWSANGNTLLYLHFPENPAQLNAIREWNPDTEQDQLIASTSQFVSFSANGDASVFVGASRNQASPHVLLLLRVARRELTLCEHRAGDPARVAPMFSPDSQQVYFQTDKHGKPAIYCLPVEKLVEKTET